MKNVKQSNKSNNNMILNDYVETITKMLRRGKIPTITLSRYEMLLNKHGLNK